MTDQEKVRVGEAAKQLLNNEAFECALKQLHQLAFEAYKKTDLRDAEGLKIARQFSAVTEDFECIIRRIIEGGKLAKFNIDKHRDEPAVKRTLRRIVG